MDCGEQPVISNNKISLSHDFILLPAAQKQQQQSYILNPWAPGFNSQSNARYIALYCEYYDRIITHHDPHHPWQPRFVCFFYLRLFFWFCDSVASRHTHNTLKQNTHKHQQIVKFWGSLLFIMAIITMAIITMAIITMKLMKVPTLKAAKNCRCLWCQQVLNQLHQGFVFFFFLIFLFFRYFFLFC